MIFAIPLLVLTLGVSAAVLPRQTPCTFSMSAIGAPNGTIEEDTIGENRIGGTYPQGSYIITDHALTDVEGHNCLIYPDTLQFECTQGTSGTTNFSLADNGDLLHDGSANYLACPAPGPGDDGSYNIFSDQKSNTTGCQTVTLATGSFSCAVLGRPSSSPSSTTSTSSPILAAASSTWSSSSPTPTSTSTSPSCPTDISSSIYQFPHLIIPTSSESSNYAFGNSYTAHISPINTTLFNFDIPSSNLYLGSCALLFLFPYASSLDPSAGTYYFSGLEEEEGEHGGLDFALLGNVANQGTTYDTMGDEVWDFGTVEIVPGNSYTVATFECQSGRTVTFEVSSRGDVELDYFQDSAPAAIGLYVVPCA